jgi:hypothetical protein
MSGFEVIGVIMGMWPDIKKAVAEYKATEHDMEADMLRDELDTEELIFKQFLHALFSSDVADADLVQLIDIYKPNVGLWRDQALHSKIERRLGADRSRILSVALEEIEILLFSLRDKLEAKNIDTVGLYVSKFIAF